MSYYKLTVPAEDFASGIKAASLFASKERFEDVLNHVCLAQHKRSGTVDITALDGGSLYQKRIRLEADKAEANCLPIVRTVDGLSDYGFLYLPPIAVADIIKWLPRKPAGEVAFAIAEEREERQLYYDVDFSFVGDASTLHFRTKQIDYPDTRRFFDWFPNPPAEVDLNNLYFSVKDLPRIAKAFSGIASFKLEISKDERCFKLADRESGISVITMAMVHNEN